MNQPTLFVPVAYDILRNPLFSAADALVHGYIWSFSRHKKPCFASQRTIAEDLGMSRWAVRDSILQLEYGNALQRVKKQRGPRRSTTAYYVLIPPLPQNTPNQPEKAARASNSPSKH